MNCHQLFLIKSIYITAVFTSVIKKAVIEYPEVYREKVFQLIQRLEMDFTQFWIYRDIYPNSESLGVTPMLIQKSFANFGDEKRLKNILIKALHGYAIQLPIVGGSISRGAPFAESGEGDRVYFNAIVKWWNDIFMSITTSKMQAKSISIGGVGTDYFSYCLNSHLSEDAEPKMILWELAANDRGRYDDKPFPPGQPLEQFTRNILQRQSKPALFFLNFFRGHDYLDGKCMNYEDEGGLLVARHYRISSISWRNFVCDEIKQMTPGFSIETLFSADRLHPSILGHAQMAFLVINHIKNSFLRMLINHASRVPTIADFQEQTYNHGDIVLADILYHETSNNKPLCYTYLKYNEFEPNNTLAINIIRQDDFHFNVFKKFKIRSDELRGMQTYLSEQLLQISFDLIQPYSRLVITTHSSTGSGQTWLDADTPVIIETDKYHMGTKVELITTNLKAGMHILSILSTQNGFVVCAISVI
ncbi:uncharacterized protein LOC105848858 [Hydra vulgaris]|uniref:Uncharacterized protein LOC105848858 n=1 Tax=Hydra vulgaris TaxID=6087 RepID=A0ABM4CX02_HYDVU